MYYYIIIVKHLILRREDLRCPICGAKMVQKQICPYCKVTDTEVLEASNKKVKEARKAGNKDLIHTTTTIPKDVSRLKLILFTIFLGFVGVNHYYINRPVRATFSVISTAGSIAIFIMYLTIDFSTKFGEGLFALVYQILFYCMALNVVFWILDIFNVIFKSMKIPVVMPDKER